jgi:hypothetical protein
MTSAPITSDMLGKRRTFRRVPYHAKAVSQSTYSVARVIRRQVIDRMRACFSRQGAPEAFLYAFDVLELDDRDLRNEWWARWRHALMQLLTDADSGIRLCEHIEDVDGAVVFRQACVMGLESIVAKRRDSSYLSYPLASQSQPMCIEDEEPWLRSVFAKRSQSSAPLNWPAWLFNLGRLG